ncbi:dehydrodolichyl diphosphate synthase complex subunit nus1 isoform X2 [Periplaneta americana]|uniref:dehydrodolichyl diphosphate synthase complex subunit nus1 isoform X2 n=1 Tax=Periplaneta americana TaxID=6978 RepID=UPI0037E8A927
MTFSLFHVTWALFHMLLSAVQFIKSLWIYLRRKIEDLFHKGYIADELGYISKQVKLFEKIPSHLVVIVGNETISFKDLANIAVWCIAAGISFISFYDHQGVTSSHSLHLNIFSLADGKGSLVELTKTLCQSVLSGQTKSSEVNRFVIDEKLHKEMEIPDPELILYCGDICSMYGFLPWQIRVTEFLQLNTHHNLKVTDFTKVLSKYGKCVQRFGK